MGVNVSKFVSDYCDPHVVAANVAALVTRKRKLESDEESDSESALEKSLHTPRKKKLRTTAQYIFKAMFQEGNNSDVTVNALDRPWKLHKVYLCQSPYFASMFSGAWKESTEDTISIRIVDPKITPDSLYKVLGSLYHDEITLEPIEVVPTLATATLFQLDGIIEQCAEVMLETVNAETAVSYYEAACEYGVQKVKVASFKWLLVNLLSFFQEKSNHLRVIGVDLMQKLVSSSELFVMQTEFSLYVALRYWAFLRLHPEWETTNETRMDSLKYFQKRKETEPFLLSKEGQCFAPTFKALRFQHLVNHHLDIQMLKADRIIPDDWLTPAVTKQWFQTLRVDQGLDRGPKSVADGNFPGDSFRCGRTLMNAGEHVWRWTGFNMGLDLIWTCNTRTFRVKRNHRTEHEVMLSMQSRRNLMCKVTIASLNEQRQVKHKQCSGIRSLTLFKNEEATLLVLDKDLIYPLLVSVNLLFNTAINKSSTVPSPSQNPNQA